MAALLLVATSSAAVLSAKRLAASSAFTTGVADMLSLLSSLTEYLGSTKAKSEGFSAFCAEAGAETTATAAVGAKGAGTGTTGAETTEAEARAICGATLAATAFGA